MRVTPWTGAGSQWDAFVDSMPNAMIYHRIGWKAVMEESYGHKTFYLAAHDDHGLRGILPLVLTRSVIFGTNLSSLPYLDYGGILASDDEAKDGLLKSACAIGSSHKAALSLSPHFPFDPIRFGMGFAPTL